MSYVYILLSIVCLNAGLSYGMECPVNDNILDKIVHGSQSSSSTHSCPGFFDSSDEAYCCYDLEKSKYYCCNIEEFGKTATWVVGVGVAVFVGISLLVCCVSCLCCSCCPWYRRRHQGTVYGRVQTPNIVQVIQTPANVAQPTPYYTNASNPTSVTGMPQPPPPYASHENEVYAKQAPYNPNYVS